MTPQMTIPQVNITPFPPNLIEAQRKAREKGKFLVCVFTEDADGTVHFHQTRNEFSKGAYLTAYQLFAGEMLKVDVPKEIAEQPE